MKQIILTTTLFVLSYVALAQCDEKAFNKLMNDAQTAETNNDYQKAVNKYTAAIIICPDRAEEAQQKIVGVFKKIERLKDDAQQAEIKATALLAKSKELTKAFLPEGKKDLKVWQYFGTKADSAFALGEYAEADKNYKLAKNDPDLPPKNDIETRLKTNLECWEWQKKAISDLEKQNLAEAEKNILKNLTLNPNNRKDIIIASAINPLLGLVLVQGGTFLMGNPDETIENSRNERPVHTVTLSSFEMSRYEVTNMQYAAFLNQYGTDTVKTGEFAGQELIYENNWGVKKTTQNGKEIWQAQTGYEYHPVVYVTWYGANEYAQFYGLALPTEAQWEYAAGGGNPQYVETLHATSLHNAAGGGNHAASRTQYAGTDSTALLGEYAWYSENSSSFTHTVGTKKPNRLGLYDMSGNVWEWCSSWYVDYGEGYLENAENCQNCSYRVNRGGGWSGSASYCRVAFRSSIGPDDDYGSLGFRVARVP